MSTPPANTAGSTNAIGTNAANTTAATARSAPTTARTRPAQAPSYTVINTPTFDQAARDGRAKEERRRARGKEPRVYGIAPRTENDLTWRMPDDRIIRY